MSEIISITKGQWNTLNARLRELRKDHEDLKDQYKKFRLQTSTELENKSSFMKQLETSLEGTIKKAKELHALMLQDEKNRQTELERIYRRLTKLERVTFPGIDETP